MVNYLIVIWVTGEAADTAHFCVLRANGMCVRRGKAETVLSGDQQCWRSVHSQLLSKQLTLLFRCVEDQGYQGCAVWLCRLHLNFSLLPVHSHSVLALLAAWDMHEQRPFVSSFAGAPCPAFPAVLAICRHGDSEKSQLLSCIPGCLNQQLPVISSMCVVHPQLWF